MTSLLADERVERPRHQKRLFYFVAAYPIVAATIGEFAKLLIFSFLQKFGHGKATIFSIYIITYLVDICLTYLLPLWALWRLDIRIQRKIVLSSLLVLAIYQGVVFTLLFSSLVLFTDGKMKWKSGRTLGAAALASISLIVFLFLHDWYSPMYTFIQQDQAVTRQWSAKPPGQHLAETEFQLGLMSEYGIGLNQSYPEAFFWFSLSNNPAALQRVNPHLTPQQITQVKKRLQAWEHPEGLAAEDKANAQDMYILGKIYLSGYLGLPASDTNAAIWFRKAADRGNARAQYWVGWAYEQGRGVKKDLIEAIAWFKKASAQAAVETPNGADKTHPDDAAEAESRLGYIYLLGRGVQKNNAEALKWFVKSAGHGNLRSAEKVGSIFGKGAPGITKDIAAADKWYRKSLSPIDAMGEVAKNGDAHALTTLKDMAQKGNVDAQLTLGNIHADGQESLRWYRMAADHGNIQALRSIGKMYRDGAPSLNKDSDKAKQWFDKATVEILKLAESGDTESQYEIAWYYARDTREPDFSQALKWFRAAAEKGNAHAQLMLGVMYANGNGTQQNYQEAMKWWLKSAYQGNEGAFGDISNLYHRGEGVKQDYTEAFFWNLLSVKLNNGDISSVSHAYSFANARLMSLEDMAKTYKRVAEWKKP